MVETGTHAEELAVQVVGALKDGLSGRLVAVVLFGSRARGEGSETSDWDLLLIAEGLPAKTFDRSLYLKQLITLEWRGRVSMLAKTPEQFHGAISSLYLDVALDGQILYDPRGFAVSRLRALRRGIEQLGLRREPVPEGFDWRWEHAPAASWSLSWSV
jgi:predicted nucleotidyltransferase